MRKIVLFLALAMFLVPVGYVFAGDQTTPNCEPVQQSPTTPQAQDDQVSYASEPVRGATGGTTGACEGEHWDGQDPTSDGFSGTGVVDQNGVVGVSAFSNYDQSAGDRERPDPFANTGDVAHARAVAGPNANSGTVYVYTTVDIYSVGDSSVAVDPVHGTAAWYGQDNTAQGLDRTGTACTEDTAYNAAYSSVWGKPGTQPGCTNGPGYGYVLADGIHFGHVTEGAFVGPESGPGSNNAGGACTQSTYTAGTCTRDNTAITVELLA
ncbi:MAG: hypothetical protein ACYDDF_09020 [Thermoplasmatota archaeon]